MLPGRLHQARAELGNRRSRNTASTWLRFQQQASRAAAGNAALVKWAKKKQNPAQATGKQKELEAE